MDSFVSIVSFYTSLTAWIGGAIYALFLLAIEFMYESMQITPTSKKADTDRYMRSCDEVGSK